MEFIKNIIKKAIFIYIYIFYYLTMKNIKKNLYYIKITI
jgi:hypothetical protein